MLNTSLYYVQSLEHFYPRMALDRIAFLHYSNESRKRADIRQRWRPSLTSPPVVDGTIHIPLVSDHGTEAPNSGTEEYH